MKPPKPLNDIVDTDRDRKLIPCVHHKDGDHHNNELENIEIELQEGEPDGLA